MDAINMNNDLKEYDDLKEYESYLKKLSEADSPIIISNGGKNHAVVLYSVLLDKSKSTIRIFCQSGGSEVWTDEKFKNALKSFLNKEKTKLEVLTVCEPALSSEWTNIGLDKVETYHILPSDKEKIYEYFRNDKCNFAVFDEKSYRYEYDCDKFKAYGSFNSITTAKRMITLFSEAFKNAKAAAD